MSNAKKDYAAKLLDPRWQKMRLQIMERDGWQCLACGSRTKTLHVHHRWYRRGAEPWEYPLEALATLCVNCHEVESQRRSDAEQELLSILRGSLFVRDIESLIEVAKEVANDECPRWAIQALRSEIVRPDGIVDLCERVYQRDMDDCMTEYDRQQTVEAKFESIP